MTSCRLNHSWITAQSSGTEHAVTDEAQVAGMEAGMGWFEPVCGQVFLAACMDVGPLDRCSSCRAFLRAQAEMRSLDERINRPNWFARLFCHRKRPADAGSELTEPPIAPTPACPGSPDAPTALGSGPPRAERR